ncbi:MAG: CDP-diacylglycerol--glycerol-3-phosphate 3-phosphatidyltransferase [Propionibacteriaceae bacterium]|jgi:CDP-diacylglycerol--glycerol-3-phosphate 3-phosphatidyltransferase|nr:CDP-diacylglycerol--glycerol-3-phosphate 3-phosphatidyltransferase [Propionibacteriaceae bacterium]
MTESDKVVPVVNLPNALTVLRLAVVPVFAWMLLAHPHDMTWRWITTAVFIVALLTDLADGAIARKKGLITDFGKLWDPIADKAITGMAMIGLSILGELWWWVTIIILIREWGITIMRFMIVKYGVQAADKLGKMKTLFQTIALVGLLAPFVLHMNASIDATQATFIPEAWYWVCLILHWVAVIAMGIAFILTVVSGVNYCIGAWKLRQNWLANQADGQDSTETEVHEPDAR